MDWHRQIDIYCERLDASFWAEPINAVTNAAFLIAAGLALWLWRREAPRDWPRLFFIIVLTAIGIGSFLFHTVATVWAALTDVVPIAIFIYGFFFLALRRFFGAGNLVAGIGTVLFLAGSVGVNALLPDGFLNGSGSYLPALAAIFGLAAMLFVLADHQARFLTAGKTRARETLSDAERALKEGQVTARRAAGWALLIAGIVFVVSVTFRSIDMAVCAALPIGVHYMWHVLNAVVLFYVLESARAMRPQAA